MFFFNRILIMLFCLFLQGCADNPLGQSWEHTKSFYYSHINRPATINYDNREQLQQAQSVLASQLQPFDDVLRQLERHLEKLDRGVSPEDVRVLFARFPWLSGVQLLHADGTVLAQEPEYSLKELDFTPMLDLRGQDGQERSLRAFVQDTPLGAETALAVPVFRGAEFMALLIVHFDMSALVPVMNDPDQSIVLAGDHVLWSGDFDVSTTPLAQMDWKKTLRNSVTGDVKDDANQHFLWTSRYLGTVPLVFAVPVASSLPTTTAVTMEADMSERDNLTSVTTTPLSEAENAPATESNLSGTETVLLPTEETAVQVLE